MIQRIFFKVQFDLTNLAKHLEKLYLKIRKSLKRLKVYGKQHFLEILNEIYLSYDFCDVILYFEPFSKKSIS